MLQAFCETNKIYITSMQLERCIIQVTTCCEQDGWKCKALPNWCSQILRKGCPNNATIAGDAVVLMQHWLEFKSKLYCNITLNLVMCWPWLGLKPWLWPGFPWPWLLLKGGHSRMWFWQAAWWGCHTSQTDRQGEHFLACHRSRVCRLLCLVQMPFCVLIPVLPRHQSTDLDCLFFF